MVYISSRRGGDSGQLNLAAEVTVQQGPCGFGNPVTQWCWAEMPREHGNLSVRVSDAASLYKNCKLH